MTTTSAATKPVPAGCPTSLRLRAALPHPPRRQPFDVHAAAREHRLTLGLPVRSRPHLNPAEVPARIRLVVDGYDRYVQAERGGNLVEVAETLVDLIHTVADTMQLFGLEVDEYDHRETWLRDAVTGLRDATQTAAAASAAGSAGPVPYRADRSAAPLPAAAVEELTSACGVLLSSIRYAARRVQIPFDDVLTETHAARMNNATTSGGEVSSRPDLVGVLARAGLT